MHLTKNASKCILLFPLLNPDGSTAIASISKAELFALTALTFFENYIVDDSGRIPSTHHPCDFTVADIKILNDVSFALSELNP